MATRQKLTVLIFVSLSKGTCWWEVISNTKLIVKKKSNSLLTKIGGFFRIYHDDKKCAFSEKCVLNKADREGGWNNYFKYAAYLICELFFFAVTPKYKKFLEI